MGYIDPGYLEHQRKRFTRNNAQLYIRHDAWRFAPPGFTRRRLGGTHGGRAPGGGRQRGQESGRYGRHRGEGDRPMSRVARMAGRGLMVAGAIVTAVGVGTVLVHTVGLPRYWMTLIIGVGLLVAGAIMWATSRNGAK